MKSATQIARELLANGEEEPVEIRDHEFADDAAAHDDAAIERLYTEFGAECKKLQAELTRTFGKPSETGQEDGEIVPHNGVFQFAAWEVEDQYLFVAASHEDRELPILLTIGTVPQ